MTSTAVGLSNEAAKVVAHQAVVESHFWTHLSDQALGFLEPAAMGAFMFWFFGIARSYHSALMEDLPRGYDFGKIASYWEHRPFQMASRCLEAGHKIFRWLYALIQDERNGLGEQRRRHHAIEARELCTDLGVTFIKIAQVWASRPDVLPAEFIEEFQHLLQNVRPFSKEEAIETLRRSKKGGVSALDLVDDDTCFDRPIASASVGQVYKGTMKGKAVAIKVQRPDVRLQATLDLYMMRRAMKMGEHLPFEPLAQQSKQMNELFDITAPNFLTELDYEAEAANQRRFADTVANCELIRDTIAVPEVLFCTREVLVQEWLDGTKLTEPAFDQKHAKEVVTLLLNSYMVQFLETGFLHGDPHPGNFIRLKNGKLGILDYGLMTTISREKRLTFIEFIMHLQAKEYDACLIDLVTLEFFPESLREDKAAREVILPALTVTLSTLYEEGGDLQAKKDVFLKQYEEFHAAMGDKGLPQEMQDIARRYVGNFRLPPYFTLILRAFATLEGLGLKADKDFAIVKECFPYIARRLVTDDSLRIQQALKSFLYKGSRRIRPERIDEIVGGFGKFTDLMAGRGSDERLAHSQVGQIRHDESLVKAAVPAGTATAAAEASRPSAVDVETSRESRMVIDKSTEDIARVIFSPEGNFLQDMLIDEGVAAVDALSRVAVLQLLKGLGPLSLPISWPMQLFLGARKNGGDVLSTEDRECLLVLRRTVDLIAGHEASTAEYDAAHPEEQISLNIDVFKVAQDLARLRPLAEGLLPTITPGASHFARRFAQQLGRRILQRVADDIEQITWGPVFGGRGSSSLVNA